MNSKLILPSQFRKQKEAEKNKYKEQKKERALRKTRTMSYDSSSMQDAASEAVSHANTLPETAVKHLDFLSDAMRKVQEELDRPTHIPS